MATTDEEITINLSDEDFLFLAIKAHEQDITFNQLINKVLREQIKREEIKKLVADFIKEMEKDSLIWKKIKDEDGKGDFFYYESFIKMVGKKLTTLVEKAIE